MKNLTIATLLSASTLLAMAGVASAAPNNAAQGSVQMQQYKGGMSVDRGPLAKINLTATQKAQITAIQEAKKTERNNNRAQNKVQREQMRGQMQALSNASTLDNAALNRLADQHAAQSKQRFISRVQTQQAIAKVLTTEQRAQLQQMKAERGEQGARKGRGHGRNGA